MAMISTSNDLFSHVAAHAGVAGSLAERVTRVVLAGIGGYLSPARRQFVADELPPALAALVVAGADLATPIEEHVLSLDTTIGHARELIASVCRVLAEELSSEAIEAIRAALPAALGALFAPPEPAEPEPPPGMQPPRETIAAGRPGSHHPVSDAHGRGAQSDSIAEDNPHAATKLSTAKGSTQERHGETIAEGRPGYRNPLSGSRH